MSYKNPKNSGRRPREDREMFDIVCSDCGKEAQVPFKPTEGRPVYCQDDYKKHNPPRQNRY